MEVILLENIGKLGKLGDTVHVRPGFGRNYLIPQGKAVPATAANTAAFEARRAELEATAAKALAEAQQRADALAALGRVTITANAGTEGKLFGSIGTRDIAEALTAAGCEVDKAEVRLPEGALRVFVVGGGCSGYQYGMALAAEAEEGDIVVERNGVKIVVDTDSAPLLGGAEVDYTEDIMKSGFTIFNPNAVKSCACGSSFQTADGSGQARACS